MPSTTSSAAVSRTSPIPSATSNAAKPASMSSSPAKSIPRSASIPSSGDPVAGAGCGGNRLRNTRPYEGSTFRLPQIFWLELFPALSAPKIKGANRRFSCANAWLELSCGVCENPFRRIDTSNSSISSSYRIPPLSDDNTSQNAVVSAPPRLPYRSLPPSLDVWRSRQPANMHTSPRVKNGFQSSFHSLRSGSHVQGRSSAVPEWHASITAVREQPSGSGRTDSCVRMSSEIMPLRSKSQGRMVSFMPSSSKPFGSGSCAPCPE
mmetsp:Transcript_11293/g.27620  ORF Transcript_11293/g.27620 Transcript_11293/m.27620 type:complete len:264 (-) Transcript_11293:63-854(-)